MLNYNFTIPNLNFIVLSTILVNFAQNKTIHIYCREFSAAKNLYHDLERMLGVFGIKSHLIGNDSDAKIIEYYYQNVPVLFGSCEGFNGDSLFSEDVTRRLTLRRDTVFFTDVNLVPDSSQNYYNQFANYENNKYISGISSSFTLATKYENVLGIGLGNYISKEILKYSFPQNLSIHDCAVSSLKIHMVKGNFISLRTTAKLAQNYNIDYNKFC